MTAKPKLDVAISFLVKNEAVSRELNDKLEGSLSTFFFPRKQEELAGTDGLESMREPFVGARIAVVIFDEPWGETPWTRVEATAIKDRCLAQGWDGLMFVQVNKNSKLPKWLPTTHVRFSLQDYPIEQLAGAIKARVQQQGGEIKKLDAVARGRQVRSEQEYLAARDSLVRDFDWIRNVVHASVRWNMQEIVRLADELNKDGGFSIQVGAQDRSAVMRQAWVSVVCGWTQPIANLVADDPNYGECHVRVAEFSGRVLLPGEQAMYMHRPTAIKEHRFKVAVSQTCELMWKEKGNGELIPADKLADRSVQIFLDVISRMNNGQIPQPGF